MPNPLHDPALFGEPDARNPLEASHLERYFLSRPECESIEAGTRTIVVGRKGTGKSALRQRLLQSIEGLIHVDVPPPVATHPYFTRWARAVEGQERAGIEAYSMAWRAHILGCTASDLLERGYLKIADFKLRALPSLTPASGLDRAYTRIKEFTLGIKSVMEASATFASEGEAPLPSPHDLELLATVLKERVASAQCIVVPAVDRVDRQLDQPLAGNRYEQYVSYLGGLLLATAGFTGHHYRRHIRPYAFVREDLYNDVLLRHHNSTEFEGVAQRLHWNEVHLMDLLALRLSHHFRVPYDTAWPLQRRRESMFSDSLLYRVFDRRIGQFGVWSTLIGYTNLRPRELIQLCNSCREAAIRLDADFITEQVLEDALWAYSQRRYEDLVSELMYRVVEIRTLIDGFRDGPKDWATDRLSSQLETIANTRVVVDLSAGDGAPSRKEQLFQVLYRAGFLVAPASDGRFVGYAQRPHLRLASAPSWCVHPGFWRELGLA